MVEGDLWRVTGAIGAPQPPRHAPPAHMRPQPKPAPKKVETAPVWQPMIVQEVPRRTGALLMPPPPPPAAAPQGRWRSAEPVPKFDDDVDGVEFDEDGEDGWEEEHSQQQHNPRGGQPARKRRRGGWFDKCQRLIEVILDGDMERALALAERSYCGPPRPDVPSSARG